jgi:outer membrane protein
LKKTYTSIALTALFFLAFTGVVSAQELKIGVVNAIKVFEQSPQYEAARKNLEAEFSRKESDLIAQQKQVKKLEEKLSRDGAVMSESEVRRLERDIVSRHRKLKNSREEYREDFNLRRNELQSSISRQVAEIVQQVGKEEGMDIILTDGVIYASKRVNISGKILQRLKEKFEAEK